MLKKKESLDQTVFFSLFSEECFKAGDSVFNFLGSFTDDSDPNYRKASPLKSFQKVNGPSGNDCTLSK